MQDAGKVLTDAWVKKTDKEAETDFKSWDKTRQKKWQQDYLVLSLKAFEMALANAKETLGKINAIKDSVKTAIDGTEKIIAAKRKSNEPLSDAERGWIAKAKGSVEGSEAAVNALTKTLSENSPFAGRGDYYKKPLEAGAIPADMPGKIRTARQASIDVGNEFGKSGPTTNRLAEYRARWIVLAKELDGLGKQRSGNQQEWALAINKQLKEFQVGNEKWESDLTFTLSKVAGSLKNALGVIDANPKNFGASLAKAIKIKMSSKAKDKASDDAKNVKLNLKMGQDRLKEAKGSLKTRLTEYNSLEAQLKDAGPFAEPQRKVLAALGKKLADLQATVQTVAKNVDDAAALASK